MDGIFVPAVLYIGTQKVTFHNNSQIVVSNKKIIFIVWGRA